VAEDEVEQRRALRLLVEVERVRRVVQERHLGPMLEF
jgi:hypothetical protein